MDCPQLKALTDRVESDLIAQELREPIETHVEECRTCRAGLANFLQIGKILEKTVYGESGKDNVLRYLCHLTGRNLQWESEEQARKRRQASLRSLLIKIFAGFFAAAGVGASVALLLGYFGIIGGRGGPAEDAGPPVELATPVERPAAPPGTGAAASAQPAGEENIPVVVPEGGLSPEGVNRYLESFQPRVEAAAAGAGGKPDSTRLKTLEAELGALRDALSRTPGDPEVRRRTMTKQREVIEERKRTGAALRVSDYYRLGYLHYAVGEYPQTAIVTSEGLRLVRMGPTLYLHYLKGMSHYKLGLKALEPLPPDTSSTAEARVAGAAMRAELDAAARRRAVVELRRAIAEYSHLLGNPELAESAREWILECNKHIENASTPQ